MYCSTCGTKLADNASFCPNCGTKVEREETPVAAAPVAPVAEEIKVEEPAPAVEEVKAEEPAPAVEEVKVEEPAPFDDEAPTTLLNEDVKVEEPVAPVVEEVKPVTPVVEEVKKEQPVKPAPAPKKAKEKKPKKKGKGCLIAVIIAVVIAIILLVIVAIIAIVGLIFGGSIMSSLGLGKAKNPNDYSYISSYYDNYQGTSIIVQTSGAQSLADFYAANGIAVDVNDLLTDQAESLFAIALYESEISKASWDMNLYEGDFFGYNYITNNDCYTIDEFQKEAYFEGDLIPDGSGNFSIYVYEQNDNLSSANSFGGRTLGLTKDIPGEYSIQIEGNANGSTIEGTMVIIMNYEGMSSPYSETITFTAER